MEPSSAGISEPGGVLPGSARSLVVFADIWMAAWRSSLVAFWKVALPTTGPRQVRAAAASTRVCRYCASRSLQNWHAPGRCLMRA